MSSEAGQQHRIMNNSTSQKTTNSLRGMKVTQDWNKWLNWLQKNNLQSVGILDYYLGKNKVKTMADTEIKAEEKFLLCEIFIDMVNAGAFKFSQRVDPKDFHFKFDATLVAFILITS